MSEDTGCAKRFLCALFTRVVKPISDLRLLISVLCALRLALWRLAIRVSDVELLSDATKPRNRNYLLKPGNQTKSW